MRKYFTKKNEKKFHINKENEKIFHKKKWEKISQFFIFGKKFHNFFGNFSGIFLFSALLFIEDTLYSIHQLQITHYNYVVNHNVPENPF